MKNLLVTHTNPDLDAVSALWLFKRFVDGWEDAELRFVLAGKSYKTTNHYDQIIHVDTGMGEFDHHQDNRNTCATKLVFDYLVQYEGKSGKAPYGDVKHIQREALARMVAVINEIDHFRQVYFPDANADYHQFHLDDILGGLNLVLTDTGSGDIELVDFGTTALDGIYRVFQNKVRAEKEIEKGGVIEVKTRFGPAIGFETGNDAVLDIAQKQGFVIAVRKDARKGYVRIKSLPDKGIDLEPLYELLHTKDPEATWFLHASHSMLLNGSTKNPRMKASTMPLTHIMDLIRKL